MRDWDVSNALDCLDPMFRGREMTPEEIKEAAQLCGLPMYELWKAEHLYEVLRGQRGHSNKGD